MLKARIYQELATRTIPNPDDKVASGLHGILGLISERAEFLQAEKELEEDPENEEKRIHVKKEFGDMWWMLAEIATANDLTFDGVCRFVAKEMDEYGNYIFDVGFEGPIVKICEQYQKHFQGHEIDKNVIARSVAGVYIALLNMEVRLGPIEEIWQMNIEKLEARYPDGFDIEKSLHRAEGDI